MRKLLIAVGFLFVIAGVFFPLIQKFGIGHLPGDLIFKKGNFTFYFPITTCILLSLVVSIILWLCTHTL